MASRLPNGAGFIDDADALQPRVVVSIDGGIPLSDAERVLRDHMVAPFVADLVTAIRNFYTAREQLGPPKRGIDAKKLAAALAEMEVSTK
jgi:hypothetical protein